MGCKKELEITEKRQRNVMQFKKWREENRREERENMDVTYREREK
jgi:hypothetical protein